MDYNYTKEEVGIAKIKVGDTVERYNGQAMVHQTVCKRDIRFSPFSGRLLFGDSYHLGRKKVIKINIHQALRTSDLRS